MPFRRKEKRHEIKEAITGENSAYQYFKDISTGLRIEDDDMINVVVIY